MHRSRKEDAHFAQGLDKRSNRAEKRMNRSRIEDAQGQDRGCTGAG